MKEDQKTDTGKVKSNREQDESRQQRSDQKSDKENSQLTKEDLPDSTNESRGNTGSGQRQDSN